MSNAKLFPTSEGLTVDPPLPKLQTQTMHRLVYTPRPYRRQSPKLAHTPPLVPRSWCVRRVDFSAILLFGSTRIDFNAQPICDLVM